MPYCQHCAKELSPQAVMCPACGHPGPGRPSFATFLDRGPVVEAAYAPWDRRLMALVADAVILGLFSFVALRVLSPLDGIPFFSGGLVSIGITLLYKPIQEKRGGQTLGKRIYNIRVVRAEDGGPISTAEAFTRWGLLVFAWMIMPLLVLDALWPFWDPYKQTLHDKFARTIVVDTVSTRSPVAT